MTRQTIKWKVIGKETKSGWIWGKSYYVALEQPDTGKTTTREVPWEQYCQVNVGEVLGLNMYTQNGYTYFFKADEVN